MRWEPQPLSSQLVHKPSHRSKPNICCYCSNASNEPWLHELLDVSGVVKAGGSSHHQPPPASATFPPFCSGGKNRSAAVASQGDAAVCPHVSCLLDSHHPSPWRNVGFWARVEFLPKEFWKRSFWTWTWNLTWTWTASLLQVFSAPGRYKAWVWAKEE